MSHFIMNDQRDFISSVQLVLFVKSVSIQLFFCDCCGFLNTLLKLYKKLISLIISEIPVSFWLVLMEMF